jgi:hypothetical protein
MNTLNRWHAEEWPKWAALGVAVLYALTFIIRGIERYLAWRSVGRTIEWTMADNPQALISLCFVLAIVTLWQLEYVGKVVASILLVAVILRFIYWALWTSNIKANAGLVRIPDAGQIGNIWIGAGVLDLLALLAAIILLFANVRIIWRERGDLIRQWRGAVSHT